MRHLRSSIWGFGAASGGSFLALVTTAAIVVGTTIASGCTFGGLANYTIEGCDPGQSQAADVCERLNADPATCAPYQCDSASRHCVQKPRDDDRDGDPPIKCGGTDCDDGNAARSGRATEICDRLDNNCDGLVDEGVIVPGAERAIAPTGALTSSSDPILVPADDVRRNVLAAFIAGTCMSFVTLEPGAGGAVGTGCAVSDPNIAPHQPYPLRTSTGNAAAFVATSVCATGRLAYRVQSSGLATLDMACDPAHPAALPAVAAMPSTANANSGLIVWYEAAVADRADPVGSCASAKPVPLAVLRIPALATPPQTPTQADVLRSVESSVATRPAALLPVESAGGMLVASPLGSDVGVWLLKPDNLVGAVLPTPTHVPLTNARATALALHVAADKVVHVAIAAEIGCRPQASILLALGTLDAGGALKFDAPVEVAPASEIATAASVTWIEGRSEWWVAWLDALPHARVRRFSAEGRPIGAAIDVGKQLPLAAVSAGESVFGLDPTANGGSFVEIPLACTK